MIQKQTTIKEGLLYTRIIPEAGDALVAYARRAGSQEGIKLAKKLRRKLRQPVLITGDPA